MGVFKFKDYRHIEKYKKSSINYPTDSGENDLIILVLLQP